ncbi:hypothetical protein HPP92_027308, partial [Vanilla planifolia]
SSAPSTKKSRRRLIDGVIRDAAFRSYPQHYKTGVPYEVALPPTSPLPAHAVRFRAGRLGKTASLSRSFAFPLASSPTRM